jgi:uncharacterized protein YjdB
MCLLQPNEKWDFIPIFLHLSYKYLYSLLSSINHIINQPFTTMKKFFIYLSVLWLAVTVTIAQANAQEVISFTLVNASGNTDLTTLSDGDVINLNELASANLNVRANTNPQQVGSVVFFLNGVLERAENVSPYALAGDSNGNYANWTPSPGTYTIEAIPYAGGSASGAAGLGKAITISFTEETSEVLVTSVNFTNCPDSPLKVGESIDLEVALSPADATNQNIAFTASDGTSVDYSSGEFTAISPGSVTVTATSFSDGSVFAQCVIQVEEQGASIDPFEMVEAESYDEQSGIKLGGSKIAVGYINNNDYIKFEAVNFNKVPQGGQVIASSNTGGGSVEFRTGSLDGPLLARAAITNTGGWNSFKTFTIDVVNEPSVGIQALYLVFKGGNGYLFDVDKFQFLDEVIVTDIAFTNCPEAPISVGDTLDLDVTITPMNATNQTLAFTASDGLSVDYLSGIFSASAPGEYTVTVTSFSDGAVFAQCVILVEEEVNTVPGAPTSLTADIPQQGIAVLNWEDNASNENGYEIQASYNQGEWIVLETIAAQSTSFTDNGLNNFGYADYRVRAVNEAGASDFSNVVSVTNIPLPPTDLQVSNVTTTSFTLSWEPPAYGNDYLIESSPSAEGSYEFFDALYFGYESLDYGDFQEGASFYLRMKTNFQDTSSAFTEPVKVVLLNGKPQIVSLVLVDAETNLDIATLQNGDTINLFNTGSALNIRANTSPEEVGSVGFDYNGTTNFKIENSAPYTIGGDSNGNYDEWTPDMGENTITVTAFSGADLSGEAGSSLSINFFVINENPSVPPTGTPPLISGELKLWHKVTLSFEGPETSELDVTNPFTDYRLNVTFTNGNKTYVVPGYYAADGNAANSSATSGNIWQVHFSPDETGTWTYSASFRTGSDVAISLNPNAGSPTAFNGDNGSFAIAGSDKGGRDFRSKGRLEYVGEHYLQFAGTGEYFIKAGADAPENTFAYEDFDQTPNRGGRRKSWSPHLQDFELSDAGEYTWGPASGDGARAKGRELLGSVNYLASQEMNAFSFLTFSLDGDDDNIYPHLQQVSGASSWNDVYHDRFDVSKLAQWEKIMEYADKRGVYLHFKTQETENDLKMDGGQLGRERKLYYRELIARFGHHLALNWNLGEENDIWKQLSDPNNNIVKSYAQYIKDIDPYDHNIVIHTFPGHKDDVYSTLTGNKSVLTGASIQSGVNGVHRDVKIWVQSSAQAGRPWVVANDEQGGANSGVAVDADYPDAQLPENRGVSDNRKDVRHKVLWGTLMAGGAGVEYYYGYQTGCDDLDCQDHRTRQSKWNDARHALRFFNAYLQPHLIAMQNFNELTPTSSDYVLAEEGRIYVVYLPDGGTTTLDLVGQTGTYMVQWYNPRNGGELQNGSVPLIAGGQQVSLGNPPSETTQDWVALVTLGNPAAMRTASSDEITNEIQSRGEAILYPNPVQNSLYFTNLKKGTYQVELYDLTGRKVLQQNVGEQNNTIDLSHIHSGVYHVTVLYDQHRSTYRIYKD